MSSANDEKVVKPPQKPVIRKTFIDGEMTWVFSANPKKIPITKLPITLTANVPHGNAETVMTWASFPVRKRRHVPIKPPSPASIIALNIIHTFLVDSIIRILSRTNSMPPGLPLFRRESPREDFWHPIWNSADQYRQTAAPAGYVWPSGMRSRINRKNRLLCT